MPPDAWNPVQYERFRDERSQPFFDLLALVRRAPSLRVLDLGCGTGELTRRMHEDLRAHETLGVDSSLAMLAKTRAPEAPGLRFEHADIGEVAGSSPEGGFDLVFSNAALHWLPSHERLLEEITRLLAPKGQLAVQVPANFDHLTHTVAAEVAREPEFHEVLGGYTHATHVLAPEKYAEILDALGYSEQHVHLRVYAHRLGSRDDAIEWVKGTRLTDYAAHMPAEAFARFMDRYRARLFEELGDTRPYFFAFKRILFWAARP